MSKVELLAKIELLNKYEAMMEELKAEADAVRNSIKAEMEAREVEEVRYLPTIYHQPVPHRDRLILKRKLVYANHIRSVYL